MDLNIKLFFFKVQAFYEYLDCSGGVDRITAIINFIKGTRMLQLAESRYSNESNLLALPNEYVELEDDI